jgi:hypothetical protein
MRLCTQFAAGVTLPQARSHSGGSLTVAKQRMKARVLAVADPDHDQRDRSQQG